MSARLIKKQLTPLTIGATAITVSRERAEFKSQMVMVRFHADSAIEGEDRERAEYIYSQLLEQCRKLSQKFDFVIHSG